MNNQSNADSSSAAAKIGNLGSYLSESVDELKKVTKPTMAEAKHATLVTVALVIVVALIISLFDVIFAQLMKLLVF